MLGPRPQMIGCLTALIKSEDVISAEPQFTNMINNQKKSPPVFTEGDQLKTMARFLGPR
jgi:hypothetical protein